jgi:DNA-binding XRE family transcriptional regulator
MLNKKQKKCLELMAIGELSQKEIANQIKVSEQTICNWKKDKEFITELDLLIRTSIQSLAAKAFRTHVNLLAAKSEMVRYMVAKDILDRAGYKPDDKVKFEGAIPIVIKDDMGEDDE